MIAHAKSQPVGTRDFGPRPDDVALRTDIDAIPRLMLRIPTIEVIVVSRQRDEVLSSRAFIEFDKSFRVPFLRFPEMTDVLVSEL